MPLGTDIGLGPGHSVLVGDSAPPKKGAQQPPIFSPCLLWSNGWMDQDTIWYGDRPWPGHIVLDGTQFPHGKSHSSPPLFGPLARSPISATAELSCRATHECVGRPRPVLHSYAVLSHRAVKMPRNPAAKAICSRRVQSQRAANAATNHFKAAICPLSQFAGENLRQH